MQSSPVRASDHLTHAAPLFDKAIYSAHTDIAGITNAKYEQFTNASRHIYKKIITIFEYFDLDFFLFAGSIVGYVRNGQMPPWMDDIDVMIFEDEISKFENSILPVLEECGFNTFAPRQWPKGGHHILSLQKSGDRADTIAYSSDIDITVPWAQVDVFYSTIDEDGFIRNRDGWGQYGKKEIPFSFIYPKKHIEISGIKFPVFAKHHEYVEKEYGDVHNNIRVASHAGAFLKRDNMPAHVFLQSWTENVELNTKMLPPSINSQMISEYKPDAFSSIEFQHDASFDEICAAIIRERAGEVLLKGASLFWVMDLKRLFPALKITVLIEHRHEANKTAHLKEFIDSFAYGSEILGRIHGRIIDKLNSFGC